MLRANIDYMNTTCSQLKKCSGSLAAQLEQLEEIYSFLKSNPSLEEEAAALKKACAKAEQQQNRLTNLIRVLDYAAYEYSACEDRTVGFTESVQKINSQGLSFEKTKFNLAFKKNYSWK